MFILDFLKKQNKTKTLCTMASDLLPISVSQVHQSLLPESLDSFSHSDKETRRALISVGLS